MLKLTRGVGRRIMIGDQVIVEVIAISSKEIHLDIQIPCGLGITYRTVTQVFESDSNVQVILEEGEQMKIGESVVLENVEIRIWNNEAIVGVSAPKELIICREELYDRFKQNPIKK